MPIDTLFSPDDEKTFILMVSENLEKGAAAKRGMSPIEYVSLARRHWLSCNTDAVYAIKMLIDPLVRPEFVADLPDEWRLSAQPFCELIAAIDSDGNLANAPPGYVPPSYPGVFLAHIPAGSPSGGVEPDPTQSADYLVGFLDVLGFEHLLKRVGLEGLARRYDALLNVGLTPHSESRPWSAGMALVRGSLMPGLMHLPIRTAYFSDGLLLWVHYHPGHVAEFLDRCSKVFCQALALGLPVRGAISAGRAILDKARGIYLGLPLVEAVRLEGYQDWIGVALGASWKDETLAIPVPPDRVLPHQPPLKDGGAPLFSDLVLDWPRVWRETREDSAVPYLQTLCTPDLRDELKARYAAAIAFFDYSLLNENWFLPPGATRLTFRNIKYSRPRGGMIVKKPSSPKKGKPKSKKKPIMRHSREGAKARTKRKRREARHGREI